MAAVARFFGFGGPDVSKEQDVIDATTKRDTAKTALATAEDELKTVTEAAKKRLSAKPATTTESMGTAPQLGKGRRKHKGTRRHKKSKRARTGRKSNRL
jgi:hypothetical protein